ncbi:MAG: TolC family protein [Nitrospirota bacterium]
MSSKLKIKNKNFIGCNSVLFLLLITLLFNNSHAENTSRVITISEGLRIATENNRIIKIVSHNEDISSADIGIAKSRLLPNINAYTDQTFLAYQPGAKFGTQNQIIYTSDKSFLSYGINVYQTLYDFGASISPYEASKVSLELTKLDMARIKNIIALDFINAYYNLLETEKMILVAQREVERLESHLKVTRSLYNEGVITKNDLLQAEVRLSDGKQKLLTIKNMRAINVSRINNILSRPLKEEVQVEDVTVNISDSIELEKAWETAEKERTEIKMIDYELRILNLQETAKKAEYYPEIFARGGYNYTKNSYQLHEDNWSLIFGINLNLFSGGSTKAEVSRVIYRKEQVLEQERKLIDDIKLEVEKNYLDMKNAVEKIQVTKDAIAQAEENLKINKIKYEEGIGTATDVLDAITLLTDAETNYYRALYEHRRAHAGLIYAIGMKLVSAYK